MNPPGTPEPAPASGARARILGRVRAALEPLATRAPHPGVDDAMVSTLPAGAGLWTHFTERLRAVNGRAFEDPEKLGGFLRENGWTRGYCDPALRAAVGERLGAGLEIEYAFDRARAGLWQFGITRAAGAIAETGTLVVNDALTSSRLAALAPWVHVAALRPEDLWPDIPAALGRLGPDPNTIWITGPSKTADVEGILIEGVHGPGQQICLRLSEG
jgi:L-lactate dehydrogenase complex protein LldG